MLWLVLLLVVIGLVYLYLKHQYSYWSRRGVDQLKPKFFVGNFGDVIMQRANFFIHMGTLYDQFKGKFGGVYMFTKPGILIKDPQLIRQILIKDFDTFSDREMYVDENEPLTATLFSLRGDRWRFMRSRLSPTFTSGKLKQMVPDIVGIGERLGACIQKQVESGKNVIEMRDMMSRFTTDVITSVAFGVEIDSINNSNEKFREIGEQIVSPGGLVFFKSLVANIMPSVGKLFGLRATDIEVEKFLMSVLKQTMNLRENENVVRRDFMQLLIQIRNSGEVNEDGNWSTKIVEGLFRLFT